MPFTSRSVSCAKVGAMDFRRSLRPLRRWLCALAWLALLAGCARPHVEAPQRRPADVRAQIVRLLPADTADRAGWAADLYAAFAAQQIEPTRTEPLRGAGSGRPGVELPGRSGLPGLVGSRGRRSTAAPTAPSSRNSSCSAALPLKSPDGRSYGDRLASVRTERD